MAVEWPDWKNVIFSKGLGPLHVLYTATKAALIALDERIEDVEAGTVAPASIGKTELENDSVDSNKLDYFLSDEETGTGEAQSIAHGLGAEPGLVLIIPSLVGTDGATITFTKGSANVNVTATTGAKYKVFALP